MMSEFMREIRELAVLFATLFLVTGTSVSVAAIIAVWLSDRF